MGLVPERKKKSCKLLYVEKTNRLEYYNSMLIFSPGLASQSMPMVLEMCQLFLSHQHHNEMRISAVLSGSATRPGKSHSLVTFGGLC